MPKAFQIKKLDSEKVEVDDRVNSTWKFRTAACLLRMRDLEGNPLIKGDPEKLTVKEICAQVEFDHIIARGLGGKHMPSNVEPLTLDDHATKTERDRKMIDKAKRLAGETCQNRRGRKIQSRGFTGHRKFDGGRVYTDSVRRAEK